MSDRFVCYYVDHTAKFLRMLVVNVGSYFGGDSSSSERTQDSEEALVLFFFLISDGYTNYFSSASYDG